MKRLLALALLLAALVFTTTALAGSAHFINNATSVTVTDGTLTVTGKEAGLGDLEQVDLVLTVTAECKNRGGNFPAAANKDSLSDAESFPVQNGKAEFSLSVTPTFQPSCSPPMTVVFTSVTVTDVTNGVTLKL